MRSGAKKSGERHPEILSRHLLALHRSDSLASFWKALVRLIGETLPVHSVSLYFHYFEMPQGFAALHHQPLPGMLLPWEERRKVSPTPDYLRRHLGKNVFGSRQLFAGPRNISASEYYRKVMRAEGWRYLLCLAFWEEERPWAMLVTRRTAAMGEFSSAETGLLKSLHGHCESVLERLHEVEKQTLIRNCLSRSLQSAGVGLLILDKAMEMIFHNEDALQTCLRWNYGREASRMYEAAKAFFLPEKIRQAGARLRMAAGRSSAIPPPLYVEGPPDSVMAASVHLIAVNQGVRRDLFFCVQFFRKQTAGAEKRFPAAVAQTITARELEVALAAAKGLSNAEIAREFGKTEATVKSQLLSVFGKLRLRRRSQLAGLLQPQSPDSAKGTDGEEAALPD